MAVIKPHVYKQMGKIISSIEKEFDIAKIKLFKFSEETARMFYQEHQGKIFYPSLIDSIKSGACLGL